MSATQIRMEWGATVEDYDRMPPWILALCEKTEESCDDVVRSMLEAEMTEAGEKFIKKFPELFRSGTGLS